MQIHTFTNGGFCIHKIKHPSFQGTVSAWFNKAGKILDAEQHLPKLRQVRPIKHGGPIWAHVQTVGKWHMPKQPEPAIH